MLSEKGELKKGSNNILIENENYLAPYLALVGLVSTVLMLYALKRKRKT